MARSKLRSAKSSPDLGNFWPSLSVCWVGRVGQVLKDETCHSTSESWFLRAKTHHRPPEVLDLAMTSRFRLGWSVLSSLWFAWIALLSVRGSCLKG